MYSTKLREVWKVNSIYVDKNPASNSTVRNPKIDRSKWNTA